MSKNKVITNYSRYSDANLEVIGNTAVKDLTGNANFTFVNSELNTLTAAVTKYTNALAALAGGGKTLVTAKNIARNDLLKALHVIAIQVNLQADGDLLKLQSTGLPLVTSPQHRVQSVPIGFVVNNGNSGELIASVNPSPVGDRGTIFTYTVSSNPVTNPELWTTKHVNGHSTTFKNLTLGAEFKVSAAYKGNDNDSLVWAPVITKIVAN